MVKLALSSEGRPLEASIEQLVIAGWTGRDSAAVEHHIAELEAIGVARPKNVPSLSCVCRSTDDIGPCPGGWTGFQWRGRGGPVVPGAGAFRGHWF